VLIALAPISWPCTSFGSCLRSFIARRTPGARKLAPKTMGTIQAIAAAIRTGRS